MRRSLALFALLSGLFLTDLGCSPAPSGSAVAVRDHPVGDGSPDRLDPAPPPDGGPGHDTALPPDAKGAFDGPPLAADLGADAPPPYQLPARPCGTVTSPAVSIGYSPDGRLLAVLSRASLEVVSVPGATKVFSGAADGVIGSTRSEVAFSPDGSVLASGGRSLRVWRVSDGSLLAERPAPTHEYVGGVAFSPDGHVLAVAHHTLGIDFLAWPSMKQIGHWDSGWTAYGTVIFFPDGERVAVRTFYEARVVRWRTGETLWFQPAASSHPAMALSRDFTLIATAGLGPVRLHDAADGHLLRELPKRDGRLSFSPDGALLLVGDRFAPATIWRTDDGSMVRSFATRGPNLLLPSPDGNVLATSEQEGPVSLWCR
jgi:WD40 repeat protein